MSNREHILGAIGLYDTIKEVKHKPTRKILYIEFIHKYFPEAFKVLMDTDNLQKVRDLLK